VSNTREVIEITKSVAKKTRVFALGIGSDASPELVRGVAKAGGGEARMTASGERLEPVIAGLCARIFRPAITSLGLEWGDLKTAIKFEGPLNRGVVFSGQKLTAYAVLFENDRKKHSVTLTVGVAGAATTKSYRAEIDLGQSRAGQSAHRLAVKALVGDFSNDVCASGGGGGGGGSVCKLQFAVLTVFFVFVFSLLRRLQILRLVRDRRI